MYIVIQRWHFFFIDTFHLKKYEKKITLTTTAKNNLNGQFHAFFSRFQIILNYSLLNKYTKYTQIYKIPIGPFVTCLTPVKVANIR